MDFSGSHVAIVTPFRDGKVDEKAFRDLIEFHIENGTDGIVPCGTTGESATLTGAEHHQVVELCVKAVRKRVPVIAGTGSNSTAEALEFTQGAKDAGADAALLITPYYNKPTQAGLYAHYRLIAESVDLPQFIYNCPGRTGVSITPQTLAKLAPLKSVVGVKDATGNCDWTTEVAGLTDLIILSGDDTLTLPFMSIGAVGVISVTANILPKDIHDLVRAALDNNWVEARRVHQRIFEITKLLFIESNPIPVKTALELMGRIGPEIRMPLCAMGAENRESLRREMIRLGLIAAQA